MSRLVGTARTSIATWACLAALLVAGCEKSAEEKAKDIGRDRSHLGRSAHEKFMCRIR